MFVLSVIFHVATLMPNRESDPSCNAKKLHIGNDYVTIVYNDSNEDYRIGVIKVKTQGALRWNSLRWNSGVIKVKLIEVKLRGH